MKALLQIGFDGRVPVTPEKRFPTLVHCGYHKCLTVFVARCFGEVLGDQFHQFMGTLDPLGDFYAEHHRYTVSAISDRPLDLSRLGDYRISRFIRDPRDLVVSGYFYHRKGPEPWTTCVHDSSLPFKARLVAAGLMGANESYAACLQRLDPEDGLIAEMEGRAPHFRSMIDWPAADSRVRAWKYEDILGREAQTMDAVGAHYGWSDDPGAPSHGWRLAVQEQAIRWSAGDGRLSWDAHVRDPRPGQWREVFTDKVHRAFAERFGNLPQQLGYE